MINSEDIRERSSRGMGCSWNRESRIWKVTGREEQGPHEGGCGGRKEGPFWGGVVLERDWGLIPMRQRASKSSRLGRPPAFCTTGQLSEHVYKAADLTATILGTLLPLQVRTRSCRTRTQSHSGEEAESGQKPRCKSHVLGTSILLKEAAGRPSPCVIHSQ